ncbi:glucose-1-phosphate thymidylyltransferase [Amycolatopsis sp. A133]|uniref:glucose-1-phosphate thymidylyltransferase n=1 Tax=Amycolatopsis sp. A133 TaxID=3064472 RepID=UPI0027FB93E6|nr:glucose-1-phosphate thymidylyltransferase [Amycolatopsis sp. A133]MDQ7803523.1 glucose-1-phosphate thymidylyltransferase [Amycolatopsis sp. A133]
MKALVLAGGIGTRLRPISHTIAKQLVPVGGRPVLHHCLASIARAGVREVGIIVGDHAKAIAGSVGDGSGFGLEVTYLHQPEPLGLAHAVVVARSFLGDDDFVMYLGDNVLADGIDELAAGFRRDRPDAAIVVSHVADPTQYGVAELDGAGRPVHVVEKSPTPPSNLALVGVYFFTPLVHAAVRAIKPSTRGEWEITDAIEWLLTTGRDVRAYEYNGHWTDTGNVADLLACNHALLDLQQGAVDGKVDTESELIGRVVVREGASVSRSRVIGPVVVGTGSTVTDSYLGPYTAIGDDCRIDRAGIDSSVVLDGARLSGVRHLTSCLIGRGARVEAGPSTRLVVGDDAVIRVER